MRMHGKGLVYVILPWNSIIPKQFHGKGPPLIWLLINEGCVSSCRTHMCVNYNDHIDQ